MLVRNRSAVEPCSTAPDQPPPLAARGGKPGLLKESRDGHTFILVGPDGDIEWRADYGGAPRYTMYVPVPKIIADLKSGRQPS